MQAPQSTRRRPPTRVAKAVCNHLDPYGWDLPRRAGFVFADGGKPAGTPQGQTRQMIGTRPDAYD